MTTKNKPQTAKARPWDEIEEHYVDLNKKGWGHERLLELVRHIKSRGLQRQTLCLHFIGQINNKHLRPNRMG